MTDLELLQEYVRSGSDQRFAELINRHVHWVFPSALRQVGDRALADDVTQAVFIALAQQSRSLAKGVTLSAWLFRVVRYASAKALRAERRRRVHEQRAAVMKSESSRAVSEAEWDQMAPLLDQLVGRLGRKEQQVVLLRFYEQKSFADVAAAMGISEDAAKKRAERAIRRLRDNFAQRGVSVASSAALTGALSLYLAAPADAGLVASATAGALSAGHGLIGSSAPFALAKGVITMMMWTKAAVVATAAVVVLLAGSAGVLVLAKETAPAGQQAPVRVSPSQVPGGASGELAGTVTDESGASLAGVLVDVWTWHPGNETTTDQQGHFVLRKLGTDPVEIRFSKEGFGPWYNPNQPTGASDLKVVLSNKTYFEGNVKGPDGKPVPNALIRADCGPKQNPGVMISTVWTETHSGEDGHYRLYVTPDKYDIQVRVPKVGAARFPGSVIASGEVKKLDINLEAGVTFRAVVVDSQTGAPIPDVRLKNWEYKNIAGISDKDGNIVIEGMQPGNFVFNDIQAKGYARWWSAQATNDWEKKDLREAFQRNFDYLEFDLQKNMAPVKIELERAVTISGVVHDPTGNPVAGATVAPARTGSGNSLTGDTRFSVVSKKDGTFVMTLPASGNARYNLVAHDGKYQQWRRWANGVLEPIQTRPGDEIKDVVIALTKPAVVRGHVKDSTGKPVARREVRASAADKQENRYYDPTTKTDKDGNFELKFVRAGVQHIQVAPFWLSAQEAPAGTSADVTLKEGEVKEGVELQAKEEQTPAMVPVPLPVPAVTDPKAILFSVDAEVQRLIPLIRENEARYEDIEYSYRDENKNHAFDQPGKVPPFPGPVKTRISEISAIYQRPYRWVSLIETNVMPAGETTKIKQVVGYDGKTTRSWQDGKTAESAGTAPETNPLHPFRLLNFDGRTRLSGHLAGEMADIFRRAGATGTVHITCLPERPCLGLPCVILQEESELTLAGQTSHKRRMLWICPQRNYLPLRLEVYKTETGAQEELESLKEVKELIELSPTVYFPAKITGEWEGLKFLGKGRLIEDRVAFANVRLKPDYAEDRFKEVTGSPFAASRPSTSQKEGTRQSTGDER